MQGPVVMGEPVRSEVLLVGQAPGFKEIEVHRPFAWTAGKTLFRWFEAVGLDEARFRRCVYMAAVCRCFPGKNPKGGDRVPDADEIANCEGWLRDEVTLLRPRLVIPVGKLAIQQFVEVERLKDVVGRVLPASRFGASFELIPLPHPSGASTWHRTEPGKSLLARALDELARHASFQAIVSG